MKKRLLKFTSGIIAGIVVCLSFSCDRFYDVRKSYALENNSAAGKVEQLRSGKKNKFC